MVPTAVAGLAALFVSAEPTGLAPVDAIERAAFVALVSLAASRSSRISWIASGGIVAACAGSTLGVAGGVFALAVSVLATPFRKRSRLFGAAVGGAVGLGSMGLSDFGRFGLSLLIGSIAVLPILVSAIRKMPTRDRRRVRNGLLVGVGVSVLAIGLAAAAGLLARNPLRTGIDASRTGIAQARAGDDEAASASFDQAQASFDDAADLSGMFWALPGRAVPVVSQHLGAVRDLSTRASDLAVASGAAAGALSGQDVIVDGNIDLARVEELTPLAVDIVEVLDHTIAEAARVDVGWLVPAVAAQIDDLRAELDDSLPAARNASDALLAAPSLLGLDASRRYLVLAGNPAESRELGGFVGGFGILEADHGALSFRTIPYDEVKLALAAGPQLPPDVPAPYAAGRPQVFAQNWTDWPDFPEVSRVSAALWERIGLGEVDGVVYADPATLAALLRFTGPRQLPDTGVTLNAQNAEDFLLRGQYGLLSDLPNADRRDLLGDAAEVVFDELFGGSLPAPQVLAETLAPLVAQRRLLFHPLDGTAAPLLARSGLDGSLRSDGVDQVAVTHSNTRVNKVDSYLHRTVDVQVELDDATTSVRSTVTVTLTNTAEEGLPEEVTGDELGDGLAELDHRLNLSIYTPWELKRVTVDGTTAAGRTNRLGELQRHGTTVVVGGGQTITVVFVLAGQIADVEDYELEVVPIATAVPDVVSASVSSAHGVNSHEPAAVTGPLHVTS